MIRIISQAKQLRDRFGLSHRCRSDSKKSRKIGVCVRAWTTTFRKHVLPILTRPRVSKKRHNKVNKKAKKREYKELQERTYVENVGLIEVDKPALNMERI